MTDWIGQKLGNYQILRMLGHGGFASVYLGQQVYLKTYAAIKVLQSQLPHNDLPTFLREARTIASLTHAHIVRVLEFGEEEHTPYLIMDYCPNGTLRQRHPRGTRISLQECAAYVKQIAEALQYAHDRKIIHRDVKPENMLIGQNDTLLLSDFGIAIVSQSSRYQSNQDIGGTIAYSAPEQLQSRACAASDQYSLGIVLCEWLTGELPYQGSFPEIASQHLIAPIPTIRNRVPSLPLAVEQVLQTALAKDPLQRFHSVRAFAAALELAAGEQFTSTVIQTEQAYPATSQANVSTYLKTQPAVPSESLLTPATPPARQTPAFSGLSFSTPPYQSTQGSSHKGGRPGIYIAIIVVLLLALIGVSARAFFAAPSGQVQNGTTTPQAIPKGQTNSQTKSNPAPTPTPPASKIIPKNITIPCVSTFFSVDGFGGCNNTGITIQLNTIVIDPSGTTTLNFTIVDKLTEPVTVNATSGTAVIYLEDSTGTSTKEAGGTLLNNSSLTAGQSLPATALFPLVPASGATYFLHMELYVSHDTSGVYDYPTYKTVSMTF